MRVLLLITMLSIIGCSPKQTPAELFFERLNAHCGNAYGGEITSDDPADADYADAPLVMELRECSDNEILIPLHIDDNRSRTWIITKTENGLRLKHRHRHMDGQLDPVTNYGGDANRFEQHRVEFPVDEYSVELFEKEGLTAAVTNTWALELTEGQFVYELFRDGRTFRAEFDLTEPVSSPPAPWGEEG
ncbi:hypothetical protein [Hyphococcus sp. DH-69]|uniref:hypothetical protein n=1 Tax=Hyphococcus formosus TaxID=3143534 RepID=UPI00398B5B2A